MTKYAAQIEYFGKSYCGWQRQKGLKTVQGELEHAISTVANHKVEIFCAGRTDAGVHASSQVIHFESNSLRSIKNWYLGVNANLSTNISLIWVIEVVPTFHARFSALSRKYRYIIHQTDISSCFLIDRVTNIKANLDIIAMTSAAEHLIGEQDFSSFRAANCQSLTPMRNIMNVSIRRVNTFIIFEIEGNAFLYHMVRNIMGSLIEVGLGKKSIDWFNNLIESKNRSLASPTAPSSGLYLVDVTYPIFFNLPRKPIGPCFI